MKKPFSRQEQPESKPAFDQEEGWTDGLWNDFVNRVLESLIPEDGPNYPVKIIRFEQEYSLQGDFGERSEESFLGYLSILRDERLSRIDVNIVFANDPIRDVMIDDLERMGCNNPIGYWSIYNETVQLHKYDTIVGYRSVPEIYIIFFDEGDFLRKRLMDNLIMARQFGNLYITLWFSILKNCLKDVPLQEAVDGRKSFPIKRLLLSTSLNLDTEDINPDLH